MLNCLPSAFNLISVVHVTSQPDNPENWVGRAKKASQLLLVASLSEGKTNFCSSRKSTLRCLRRGEETGGWSRSRHPPISQFKWNLFMLLINYLCCFMVIRSTLLASCSSQGHGDDASRRWSPAISPRAAHLLLFRSPLMRNKIKVKASEGKQKQNKTRGKRWAK